MKTKNRNQKHNRAALLGMALAGSLLAAGSVTAQEFPFPIFPHPQHPGAIFVIAMENHNFVQPNPTNSPEQILGNAAAPFLNSLVTPGNSNAAQVSYSTAYYNAGVGVHPSEPNYVWAEAGSDFGVHTDADPLAANGNVFYDQAPHLTGQLDALGIPWKNYQEDVQLSVSPTNSASGNTGPTNQFYGTTQFNYAVKHNPMAFFPDSATSNVYPLAQLFEDLAGGSVGRFNWITPNQFDDAHSSLSGGFTYQGAHFTGDQSSIAQGDNFLSVVVPAIMASPAYKNNGVIIIWWDETEGGDDTNHSLPEIIISPLAKGNAYASAVPVNHSSDLKTMEEIFQLPDVNNPIPAGETNVTDGSFNSVALVNDLSDLFIRGAIPEPPTFSVTRTRLFPDPESHDDFQFVNIRNISTSPAPAPLFLALDNLSSNATLVNAAGTTAILPPLGSPYVGIPIDFDDLMQPVSVPDEEDYMFPGQSRFVILEFSNPTSAPITYDTRVLSVMPTP